jgi:hypothetical protein
MLPVLADHFDLIEMWLGISKQAYFLVCMESAYKQRGTICDAAALGG